MKLQKNVMRSQKTFEIKYEFVPSKDNAIRLQRAYGLIFGKTINHLLNNDSLHSG